MFDSLIKNGLVYEGTASKPYYADIGINGDKIAAIGRLSADAAKTIDAEGCIVAPGFIDVHTHCDITFQKVKADGLFEQLRPLLEGNNNYQYQGVTTVITGNCGLGDTDVGAWLDLVDSMPFGSNVCHLVPHGMIRSELFGDNQPRELNKEQLGAMQKRIAEEMEKGAFGVSTGIGYDPGFLSTTEELIEIAEVAKRYRGLYVSHIRDPSGRMTEDGIPSIYKSINEAIKVGEAAEVPVQISHLFICSPFENVSASKVFELIETAREKGLDVTADQHPYDSASSYLNIQLPDIYKTLDGIKPEFKTPEGKNELRAAIEKVFSHISADKMVIAHYPGRESYEGKSIEEIAGMEDREPSACYVDMVCEGPSPTGIFFNRDMKTVREIMTRDYIMTASDGGTVPKDMGKFHPRFYGTFPRKIKKHVLEEKAIDLGQAIRSMTSLPAEKFNIKNRGKIIEGNYADIAVIDLNSITDLATYESPHQYSRGIQYLFVNGVLSIENAEVTGGRGGRSLKRI